MKSTKIRAGSARYASLKTEGTYHGKLYYDTGELHYEGQIQEAIPANKPCGKGIKYFKNCQIEMEGFFGDWFIEWGKEYYKNGNLRFEGYYNSGQRSYYGPRYFTAGKLYYESGELWYEGTFDVKRNGSLGIPVFRAPEAFKEGTEYTQDGKIIKQYGYEIIT